MSIFANTGPGMDSKTSIFATVQFWLFLIVFGIALFIALQAWWWFFCRIEIDPGYLGVLISKTGYNLPSGQIIATDSSYKGIQLNVLAEGRHFYNPIFYDWETIPLFDVPANNLGVVTKFYGDEFSLEEIKAGKIVADEGEKGIQRNVLMPGKYRINTYAEKVQLFKAITIPAGYVGVVTNLTGKDAKISNTFLVDEGEKGVSKKVLRPGTHFIHPFLYKVDLMDCRSHRFELAGADSLKFPSSDAFEMTVLMTVEWAIDQNRASEIFVRIGEIHPQHEKNEVLQKVLIPSIRGFGRIEGSKYSAIEYISGKSREVFQNSLLEKIKGSCEPKGILIKSVLINDIEPPQEIATPIREREIAKEELNRNANQLLQAKAEQNLARSDELVKQEQEKVKAKTQNLVKVIDAENQKKVALIRQEKLLNMERTFLEASKKEAQAIFARGKAQADVVILETTAEAESLKKGIDAFKDPEIFSYFEFLNRIAPSMKTIFANTDGAFGQIFQNLIPGSPDKKGGKN